ncbi:MAG: hypothetical protein V4506_02405 [Bacteroidota bacterium]
MKYIILLAFLVALNACNTETKTSDQKQKNPEKDSLPVEFLNVTTALNVVPLRQLPKGFHLDSIMKTDTVSGHQTIIYYPLAETNAAFNKNLKTFIQKQEHDYIPDRKPEEYTYSSFDMWLISVDSVQKKQKFKFKMQSFYSGAAHYNNDSITFVY